ncbi:hypothetical protein DFJ74DRAFT_27124 [Hyaloraphidium curvatum]|nr:hypothetical protein DFJ74DRAFT_27124 [Hyaloraphidium curvatum]
MECQGPAGAARRSHQGGPLHVPPLSAMPRWRPLLAALALLPFSLAQPVPGELCCPGCAYSNSLNCCCDPSRPLTAVTSTAVTTAAATSTTTLVSTVRSFTSTATRTVTVAGDSAVLRLGMLVGEGVRVPLPGSNPPDPGGTSTDDFLTSGRFGIAGNRLGGSSGGTPGAGGSPETANPDRTAPQWSLKELRIGSLERDKMGMKRRTLNVTFLGALADGPPPVPAGGGSRLQRRHLCVDCPEDLALGAYRMFYGRTGRPRQSGSDAVACCPRRSTTTVTSTVVVLDLATATRTTTLAGVRTTFVTVVRTATSRSRTTSATRTTSTSRTLRTVTQPNVITQVLAGRAFFDVNEDGVYDPEVDIPYANQRLAVLTGPSDPPSDEAGTTLTDAEGLFSASVAVAPDAFVAIAQAGDTGNPFMTLQADGTGLVPDGDQIELPVPVTTTTTPFTATTSTTTAPRTLTTSRTATISLTQSPTASVTRTATAATGTGSTSTASTSVTTSSSRTTTFASITTSSGLPVFVACPNLPQTQDGRCGTDPGTRCARQICCSSSGFCEDDGGDSGAAWCGTGCQRGYGKCWANVTDPDAFSCPTYTRTTSPTRTTLTTLTSSATTFASITTSSGVPVFVPCPNIPANLNSSFCGRGFGLRCGNDDLCCSEAGSCQDDGGDSGEPAWSLGHAHADARQPGSAWCGRGCQVGYGKCWANTTSSYYCPTVSAAPTVTLSSGTPVFVPCTNYPAATAVPQACGPFVGVACPPGICCSPNGFCQDDGGDSGALWCGSGCRVGWGKCWAGRGIVPTYACDWTTRTPVSTRTDPVWTACPTPGNFCGTRLGNQFIDPAAPIEVCAALGENVPGCNYVFLEASLCYFFNLDSCYIHGGGPSGRNAQGAYRGDGFCPTCIDRYEFCASQKTQPTRPITRTTTTSRTTSTSWTVTSPTTTTSSTSVTPTYTICPPPVYFCWSWSAAIDLPPSLRACEERCDQSPGCNVATLNGTNCFWGSSTDTCTPADWWYGDSSGQQSYKGNGSCIPCSVQTATPCP